MDTGVWVLLVILAAAMGAGAMWLVMRHWRHTAERFGPEYDRAVGDAGSRSRAEAELAAREERVERLHIRPLETEERARFAASWRMVQTRFVDDPEGAIRDADSLVAEVMEARGYPMGNFQRRAADASVHHPAVVENYRVAHGIAWRHERGQATTEDLREAMVHYRALFQELLEERDIGSRPTRAA
jgi:hypothetical protein